jgi:predicted nucleic acid-binding protein
LIVYLDTSTVLRVLFRERGVLPSWGEWQEACTSDLMGVEARRAIDRSRLASAFDDEEVAVLHQELKQVEARLRRISVTRRILARASQPMATAVKTLDAIHLASALLFQDRRGAVVVFATHDDRQATAAHALGFDCIGV